ncbi:MAG: addiction module toxin RelE [Novosphingobium pentaromativorans]|uniref:Addiction module toxin RelE n=1 Tax=Novosphingobium pentaromativorans TaxID=205844 RepID=A0A2W5QXX3_9SPHN|nr:MAG: addiction module toxin RelE [Novosphingobium pentaromativorans]
MRQIEWMGSSKEDLMDMPEDVRGVFGHGLYLAQEGQRHTNAKPYGSNIELIERHDGDTYRCIYSVNIGDDIYVLHAFQKKSTSGIAVPKHVKATIDARFKAAKLLAAAKKAQSKQDI